LSDGRQKIFNINGEDSFSGNERDRLFARLAPDRPFVDVAAVSGVDILGDGRSSIAADFDNDGHLDLLVRAIQKPKLTLLRNDGPSGGSIDVKLAARAMGVGSRVTANVGGQVQVHPVVLGSGYLSAGPVGAHVGLGVSPKADRIEVRFPSGAISLATDVPAGSIVEAVEGKTEARVRERKPASIRLGGGAHRSSGPPTPAGLLGSLTESSREALAPVFSRGPDAKRLVVNLWAPWCKPCRAELPELSAWAAAHSEVSVVALSVDGAPDDAKRALKEFGARLPAGALASGEAAKFGLDASVPATYVFAPDGALLRGFIGRIDVRALDSTVSPAAR
jgi:thiol-disulfide isomerase/thioredoxin